MCLVFALTKALFPLLQLWVFTALVTNEVYSYGYAYLFAPAVCILQGVRCAALQAPSSRRPTCANPGSRRCFSRCPCKWMGTWIAFDFASDYGQLVLCNCATWGTKTDHRQKKDLGHCCHSSSGQRQRHEQQAASHCIQRVDWTAEAYHGILHNQLVPKSHSLNHKVQWLLRLHKRVVLFIQKSDSRECNYGCGNRCSLHWAQKCEKA